MLQYLFALILVILLPVSASAQILEIEAKGQFDKSEFGKIAMIQMDVPPAIRSADPTAAETIKQRNRSLVEAHIRTAVAHGAEWVITPEFILVGYPADTGRVETDIWNRPEELVHYADTTQGAYSNYFAALAKELGISLHLGTAEIDAKTGELFNAVFVYDSKGNFVISHRKTHLFQQETGFLSAGKTPTVYHHEKFGQIGVAICSEIYDQPILAAYKNLDLIALSTSWVTGNPWGRFQHAAFQTKTPVAAANNTYVPGSGLTYGPKQDQVKHQEPSEAILYGYLPYVR